MLDRIVETKREEVALLEERADELVGAAGRAPAARDFGGALRAGAPTSGASPCSPSGAGTSGTPAPGKVALMAEVKRRSPGAGDIRPGLDPARLAAGYARSGAAAVSVLTDGPYFGGSLGDLRAVKSAIPVPVLRKDFVLDELQVAEARAAGADAVLLIARILDGPRLGDLLRSAGRHGVHALVEVHDVDELERALSAGARIVGVNNRDLATFTTDLGVTLGLVGRIPGDVVVVSESGIRARDDVERLGRAGVDAVLVGETLLRADDPGRAAADLVGCPRADRVGADGA